MRLIDADAMRDDWLENGENEYVYDTNSVLASIDEQPTIDAVPIVHARWVPVTGSPGNGVMLGCTAYRCSSCGRIEEENGEPYCHCGARMDAKE